jgi:hypothetical protein
VGGGTSTEEGERGERGLVKQCFRRGKKRPRESQKIARKRKERGVRGM